MTAGARLLVMTGWEVVVRVGKSVHVVGCALAKEPELHIT
ncbi:hypothetical protein BH11ACT7_BH11ACT7_16090 [soil metagenome]